MNQNNEDEQNQQWLDSLKREEKREEVKEEVRMGTVRPRYKKQSNLQYMEECMLDRLSKNYLNLFRKTCLNIEHFVYFDDRSKKGSGYDDGLLPDTLKMEPSNSICAMSYRARRVCDKVIGAFPDAFAQVVAKSLQRAAPRTIEDFGLDRLNVCCSDIMNVMVNGMRETKARVQHWPTPQNPLALRRQRNHGAGSTGGKGGKSGKNNGTKKKSLGLHKEMAK